MGFHTFHEYLISTATEDDDNYKVCVFSSFFSFLLTMNCIDSGILVQALLQFHKQPQTSFCKEKQLGGISNFKSIIFHKMKH